MTSANPKWVRASILCAFREQRFVLGGLVEQALLWQQHQQVMFRYTVPSCSPRRNSRLCRSKRDVVRCATCSISK